MSIEDTNYYQVLEVDPNADQVVIDAAFRRLARRYHPDRNDSTFAVTFMQELNIAYGVLRDPVQRLSYDQQLKIRENLRKPRPFWRSLPIHRLLFIPAALAMAVLIILLFVNPSTRIGAQRARIDATSTSFAAQIQKNIQSTVAAMPQAEQDALITEESEPLVSSANETVLATGTAQAVGMNTLTGANAEVKQQANSALADSALAAPTSTSTSIPTSTSTKRADSAVDDGSDNIADDGSLALFSGATTATNVTATNSPTAVATNTSVSSSVLATETVIVLHTPTLTKTPVPTSQSETPMPTVPATSTPVSIALTRRPISEKSTNTPEPTPTNTLVVSATSTLESTATETPAPTETATPTETAAAKPTETNTPTSTATGTPVPTATETAVPTATETSVSTATPSPTNTAESTAAGNADTQANAADTVSPSIAQISVDVGYIVERDTSLYREPVTDTPAASVFAGSVVRAIAITEDEQWIRLSNGYWIEEKNLEKVGDANSEAPDDGVGALRPDSREESSDAASIILDEPLSGIANRNVNLYTRPADELAVVASVFEGTVVYIIATTPDEEWYKLDDGFWIIAEAVDRE